MVRYVGQRNGTRCYVVGRRWRAKIPRAFVLMGCMFFRSEEDFEDPHVVAHEEEHIRQRKQLGPLFPLVYAALSLVYGRYHNPLEVGARKAAKRHQR